MSATAQDYAADVPHIWAAVEVFYEWFLEDDYPGSELPKANRGSWFCPCVKPYDAERTFELCDEYGIKRLVDLGAGDFRFALYADREGYDVVAFETYGNLVEAVCDRFDMGGIDVRQRDYYPEFDDLVADDTAMCCFGGTNRLPQVPSEGLAVQGYFEEGITAWFAGEEIAEWPEQDFLKLVEDGNAGGQSE